MVTIVDGLEEKYQDQVEFRKIDANSPEGKSAYQAYNLLGHPAFILLDQHGELIWKGLGEHSSQALENQLIVVLQAP